MIKRFYVWSPQWRDKPQTHEVLVEIAKGNHTTAYPVATAINEAWALKVEQALNSLLKSEGS